MKKILAAAAVLAVMAGGAQGEMIISSMGSSFAVNLSSWDGSTAPPNMYSVGVTTWNGYYNMDGSYSSSNAGFAFRETSTGDVIGMGLKRGTSGGVFLNWQLKNETGSEITELTINWTAAQYTEWGRATTFAIGSYRVYNDDTEAWSSWITSGVTSDSYTATAQAEPTSNSGANLAEIITANHSATILFSTAINDGQSFEIGWTVGNGDGSQGNAHVGFLDASVTAIPEPGTLGLLALFGVGGLLMRKRRIG